MLKVDFVHAVKNAHAFCLIRLVGSAPPPIGTPVEPEVPHVCTSAAPYSQDVMGRDAMRSKPAIHTERLDFVCRPSCRPRYPTVNVSCAPLHRSRRCHPPQQPPQPPSPPPGRVHLLSLSRPARGCATATSQPCLTSAGTCRAAAGGGPTAEWSSFLPQQGEEGAINAGDAFGLRRYHAC